MSGITTTNERSIFVVTAINGAASARYKRRMVLRTLTSKPPPPSMMEEYTALSSVFLTDPTDEIVLEVDGK
jgi:hypothetical protein